MSTEKNVQTVKDFFAAISHGDREGLLALVAEDIEWIIPGEDWPLAGTRHGRAGLADLLETASKTMETFTEHRERGPRRWTRLGWRSAGPRRPRTRAQNTFDLRRPS
jgi:ketosteroid isomerase-like protein